jgi:TPR repeat protein
MDPNHPVITPESPKPPALKPDGEPNDASNPASAKDKDATDSSADESAGGDSAGKASTTDNGSNAKAASSKSGANEGKDATDASDNTSKTPEKTAAAGSAKDAKDSDESAKPESDGPAAKVTKTRSAAPAPVEEKAPEPKSLGDKDPLLIKADKYIQGRGVRKNCSTGVNLLRQAMSEGNPEADVKMGALYWSGTCVTQSNVTAYQWFSRAHSLEPKNRWIERSRNSLWASMSAAEKRRVNY